MKRVVLIVLDSVGCGYMPDADRFGDKGADTLGHVLKATGVELPNLAALGLYALPNTSFRDREYVAVGCYGKCAEKTLAKDTTCGHWEMAGYIMDEPFKTYPEGFPRELLEKLEAKIGRKTMGNEVASGTEIIARLGDEHVKTGRPIVYTSADSVFQVAMHEEVIPLEEQYEICQAARDLLIDENLVGRVIARPFAGRSGTYARTGNRKDYAVEPMSPTILDQLDQTGYEVVAIGKIEDIFCHRGVTIVDHTKNNRDGIESTLKFMGGDRGSLIFTNLVDFDMLYGHRNDPEGYAAALKYFDDQLPRIIGALREEDLLIVTADHGCDPCYPGTDHTREYVPVLAYGQGFKKGVELGVRSSFADMAATIYQYLTGKAWAVGRSFLDLMQ